MEYEALLDEAYVRETRFLGVFGCFTCRYSVALLVGDWATKKTGQKSGVLI